MQDTCQAVAISEIPTNVYTGGPRGVDHQAIIDLAGKGLSSRQIGKVVGCSHVNVCDVLDRYGLKTDRARDYVKYRAEVLSGLQERILSNINVDDVSKASLLQKVTATGILYDKERLERGLSTSNIDTHVMVREGEEIGQRIADLEAELSRLVGCSPPPEGDNHG